LHHCVGICLFVAKFSHPSTIILDFFKTGKEVKLVITSGEDIPLRELLPKTGKEIKLVITPGEDTPLKELFPSVSIETRRPKYSYQESDNSGPHGRIAMRGRFVSIASCACTYHTSWLACRLCS